jgi:hypothetical protein
VCRLAAIESRRIDGASDPRTPIVRRRTHRGRPSREREQKDDEPRGTRLLRLNDLPAGDATERRTVIASRLHYRELPTSWTSVAFLIDRSPPPRGPRVRARTQAPLARSASLVDNSPREPPEQENKNEITGAFDLGEPLHRSGY